MAKKNYSVLQENNIGKKIVVQLINKESLIGKLKGYSTYEVYIEEVNLKKIVTVNKGAIIYMAV